MEDEKFPPAIIRTKLHLPPIQKDHLHRRRLLDRLDEHLQRPLTLISAPAGYGKTTLASCWLETSDDPSAWVTLDEGDNDLRLFLSYFLTAIQTIFPNMGRQTLAMVNVATIAPVKAIVGSLINEIDRIEQPFILVLDDSHLIKDESVLEVLNQLLRHPPQSMHLVLIGRRDPLLPISSLRAKGLLTEIRTQDLRFSEMETATFLTQELGTQVDLATVAALEEKTEGWVTGLRLAVLSMRHRDVIDPKLLEPHVDAQYVMEYLFTEVFSQQPPEISQYLLNTAILDRFCGPLCEALCKHGVESFTGKIGGWEFIAWLKKENMFLIPLDAENRWFRYHHLFQKLLVNQIKRHQGPEKINDLHAQAGAWLAENGIIEEALQHYLAAEDIPVAMQLVAQHGHNLMNNQQWPELERLIGMLPRDRVEQDPELLIFKAWHKHVQTSGCDLPTKAAYNKKIEPLINNLSEKALARETQINGHFEALRGLEFYLTADGENALKYFQSACDKIPMHHKRARVSAYLFLAAAYQMLGDLETGLSIYTNEIQKSIDQGSDYYAPYIEKLCYLYWINADLVAIRQTAERSLKIAMDLRLPESVAFGLYFLGIISYHQNKLKIAEEKLTQLVNNYYFLNVVMSAHGTVALAMVYMARGEFGQAEKYCKKALNYAIDTNNQEAIRIIQAFEAEYALRRGHLAKASQWAERFISKPITMPYLFYFPQLTPVRILLAQDTTDSREQAADLLKQLYDFVTFTHNTRFQIDVLALQALLYDSQDNKPSALKALTEALTLAEPSGFIRIFVDLGPPMADLMKRLIKQNVAVGYIGRILAAFRDDEKRATSDATDNEIPSPGPPVPTSPSHSTIQTMVDPLTNRELDVLDLLEQRLSNKEIAVKLFISPKTVKKHLENIYGKLNVSSRRQAVEKAVALGILPSR